MGSIAIMDRTMKEEDVNVYNIDLLKPFQCRVCFKTYTNKYRLSLHVDSKHGVVRYPCDQYGYEATQKSSLITHNNAVHANIKYHRKVVSKLSKILFTLL